jgi:hypothetical protein
MPIFFCIPPGSSLVPYPAIPSLTSSLKALNHKVKSFDLNIKAFNLTLLHRGIVIRPEEILRSCNPGVSPRWIKVSDAVLYSTMRESKEIFEEIMLEVASDQLGYSYSNFRYGDTVNKELRASIISDVWKICDKWFLEVAGDLKENGIVGFHVISQIGLMWSILLAREIKKILPEILTVLGGPALISWKDILIANPEIDAVVRGEGEATISEIANLYDGCLESIREVNGISYRDGEGNVASNPNLPFIESLDSLPFPYYDDLPLNEYPQNKFGVPIMPVVGSRGCVGNCVFCVEKRLWGNTCRMRSPESIVSEFENIKERYGPSLIRFNDSLINCNMKSLETFCNLLIERKIRMYWMGNARIRPEMTDKLIVKMRKAGCIGLWYGIESGSQRILNKMKKGYDLKTAEKVIRDTARSGIRVLIFMIVDFPGESPSDFRKSVDFLQRNGDFIDQVSISRFGVLHDSEIFRNPQKYGIDVIGRKMDANNSYDYSPRPESNRYEILDSVWRRINKPKKANLARNYASKIVVPYY